MREYKYNRRDWVRFKYEKKLNSRACEDFDLVEYCPYCKGEGSFKFDVKYGTFQCSNCNNEGRMLDLALDFDYSLGDYYDNIYGAKVELKEDKVNKPYISKSFTPSKEAVAFFAKRGIDAEVVRKFGATTDKHGDVIIPICSASQEIRGIKTLHLSNSNESERFVAGPLGIGENLCTHESDDLLVVSSVTEMMYLSELGYSDIISAANLVGDDAWIAGSWDFINKYKGLVIIPNFDSKTGRELEHQIRKRINSLQIKVIDSVDIRGYNCIQELGTKLGESFVKEAIKGAVPVKLNMLVDFSEVSFDDLASEEYIPTGLSNIDQIINGGVPFGMTTVITGKAGEGKSTFASQILVNAIDKGYKCLAYSGELPGPRFKMWISQQIAGSKHVIRSEVNGVTRYTFSSINKRLLNEWIRGRLYLYDSDIITPSKVRDLTSLIEQAILQLGVRVILLDNLMTAMNMEHLKSFEKNERQSEFCQQLAVLAQKHNVAIILVAHQRKSQGNLSYSNDDICGSSDIGNLAGVIISYQTPSFEDIKNGKATDKQRLVTVGKNRLTGRRGGVFASFESLSKRIYEENVDDPGVEFSWRNPLFPSVEIPKLDVGIEGFSDDMGDFTGESFESRILQWIENRRV